MSPDSVLRSAQKILAIAMVTVVTAAGVSAAPSTASAAAAAPAAFSLVSTRSVSPAYTTGNYERSVQYWVNVQRRHHGLRALKLATCTDAAAERWSAYLAANDAFYHQSMTKLLDRCHAYYAGETLGRGSITPRTLVSMWMHSAPHRHVLMSATPRRIGVGATPNAAGEWVVAANFMRF